MKGNIVPKLVKNAHKLTPAWRGVKNRHSNLIKFIDSFDNKPLQVGCVVAIVVQNPDGSILARTNFRVSEQDMETWNSILG